MTKLFLRSRYVSIHTVFCFSFRLFNTRTTEPSTMLKCASIAPCMPSNLATFCSSSLRVPFFYSIRSVIFSSYSFVLNRLFTVCVNHTHYYKRSCSSFRINVSFLSDMNPSTKSPLNLNTIFHYEQLQRLQRKFELLTPCDDDGITEQQVFLLHFVDFLSYNRTF
jgi:hypothetical protein